MNLLNDNPSTMNINNKIKWLNRTKENAKKK